MRPLLHAKAAATRLKQCVRRDCSDIFETRIWAASSSASQKHFMRSSLLQRCSHGLRHCTHPRHLPSARAAGCRGMAALTGHISGFLQRIDAVNNGLNELTAGNLVPFKVDGQQLGYLKPEFMQHLLSHPAVFELQPAAAGQQVLTLCSQHKTLKQRSAAVADALAALRQQAGLFRGWRDEQYPVKAAFDEQPKLLIERAAAPYFGIKAYGVHVNGYVVRSDGTKQLWVARRSRTKPTWPGLLDHIVAGGQPYGLSCADNVVKECWEEAGIPQELALAATSVGFVSYVSFSAEGLKPDVLFCYDLQLPEDFVPKPQDGEVEDFMLWDLDKVALIISSSEEYKPNVNLVVIDFLIRHGCITPEEPGYLNLVRRLRVGDLL
eukprot:GHRR01013970.1.p1 GENE.GHRR01013970.1~~GHRR01013970.1.p1  ORF type:complete len:379 (+),score=64.49 GHRR01013970.1:372-1508(+)